MRKFNSLWRSVVATLGMSLALIAVPASANAVTHAPCTHYAGTPYIDYVNDSVVFLQGGGGVLGCPSPIGLWQVQLTGVDSAPFELLGPTVSASDGYASGEPGGAIRINPRLARLRHIGSDADGGSGLCPRQS
jgi:hypothetical protein